MDKCCGKYMNWIGFGHKQYAGPIFSTIDIKICEKCGKVAFFERSAKFQPRENRPSPCAKFILNRDVSKWLPRPNDKYDKLAKKLGISRLHAIHELDGA